MKRSELETLLEGIWRKHGRTAKFTTAQVATMAHQVFGGNTDAAEVGRTLQTYRKIKQRTYDVACQGYGSTAAWRILGIHGHASKRRRVYTEAHKDYTVIDALKKVGRDLAWEVLPALHRNGVLGSQCRAEALTFRGMCFNMLGTLGFGGPQMVTAADEVLTPVNEFLVRVGEPPI